MKKILLHVCCAPCLIYPHKYLTKQGFTVTNYFYNPNIHPYKEYKERLTSLKEHTQREHLDLIVEDGYDIESFFSVVGGRSRQPERCQMCWRLRLEKAAAKARELAMDAFTSTLLVSPYQNQTVIKKIGEEIAEGRKIKFYYHEFSQGFSQAHDEARKMSLYMQKYCGCLYSERAGYLKKYRKENE